METFAKPPVREAVVDIKAMLPAAATAVDILKIRNLLRPDYPRMDERAPWNAVVQLKPGEKVEGDSEVQKPDGYIFWTSDESHAVQYRLDGFTFSQLRPYSGWEAMRGAAKRHWSIYVDKLHPVRVRRVAVRYVNLVNIPGVGVDLDDYVIGLPRIPKGFPQTVEQFLSRFIFPIPEVKGKALVTLTLVPPEVPGMTSIVFDIDVFIEQAFDPVSASLWEMIETLRYHKNEIFSNTLTDKTKELFR